MTLPSQQPRSQPFGRPAPPILSPSAEAARIAVGVSVRYGHRHLRPGWLGWLGLRLPPSAPTLHLSVAEAWELMVPDDIYNRASPLIERLARKTITRRRYRLLRALLIENSLATGQPDTTRHVLEAIAQQWKKCPARYLWP